MGMPPGFGHYFKRVLRRRYRLNAARLGIGAVRDVTSLAAWSR
jgi:hypothetical protein